MTEGLATTVIVGGAASAQSKGRDAVATIAEVAVIAICAASAGAVEVDARASVVHAGLRAERALTVGFTDLAWVFLGSEGRG